MAIDDYWNPQTVDQQRRYGQGLMQSGTDISPVGHWTQALARGLQGGIGGYVTGQANRADQQGRQSVADTYSAALRNNTPQNEIAARLMGNPWGQEQGQKMAGEYMSRQAEQNSPDAVARRGQIAAQTASTLQSSRQSAQMFPGQMAAQQAQLSQLKSQTPEYRASVAERYGLQKGTPEYNAFVISGQYSAKDELSGLISGMVRGAIAPQQQAPQPSQPRLQPQSFDGGQADPNLIQVQAAQGAPAPQQQPGTGSMFDGKTTEEKRRMGEAFLLDQRTKALGEQIMKDVDQERLGKEAGNENDKKELKAYDGLAGVKQIRSSFDPQFLTYGKQGEMAWNALVSKAGQLPPQKQAELYKFATFRRDASHEINRAIKDNSGATVTEQELKRNMAELPNAGTGIFDGDDPVTFKSKLDRTEEVLTLGIARTRYLRQNGFKGDINQMASALPVEKMRNLINQRAASIEAELRAKRPDLPKPIIDREVDARVKQEFKI